MYARVGNPVHICVQTKENVPNFSSAEEEEEEEEEEEKEERRERRKRLIMDEARRMGPFFIFSVSMLSMLETIFLDETCK